MAKQLPSTPINERPHFEFVHHTWPATANQLAPIRNEVHRWLTPLGLPGDAEEDVVFAVSEAATNSIEHAYPPSPAAASIELSFWTETTTLYIEIVDHGTWKMPALELPGQGRGIPMMQRLLESVMIHFDGRGTRVLLRHPLPSRPPRPARSHHSGRHLRSGVAAGSH